MAINPDNITTIRVDQLADDTLTLDSKFPHTVGTELKSSTIQELVDLVATAIGVGSGVGYLPISVTDGQQLPAVPTDPSFFLAGVGTYLNINGYPDLICTEGLNAIMSLTDHWEIAVEIPIVPPGGVEITNTSQLINDGEDGVHPYITLLDLPSNLILYPTDVASDITDYYKIVTDIHSPDYNTVAVDIPTGTITTTDQLVAELATEANLILGNPGVFNITTIGNIRKVSGSGTARFYFKVYKRVLAGTETLIGTSSLTDAVSSASYEQFQTSAIWDDGEFLATDRIVLKFYANRVSGGTDPVYDFQFGGSTPVRTLVPIPLSVVPGGVDSVNGQTGVVSIDLESVLTEGNTANSLPIKVENVQVYNAPDDNYLQIAVSEREIYFNDLAVPSSNFILNTSILTSAKTYGLPNENGYWNVIQAGVANFTAQLYCFYTAKNTITITDPTPVTNAGYQVHVIGGSVTIGGVAYTSGALVYRYYNGSSWISTNMNNAITIDAVPTDGSSNAVSSNGVFDALALKAPLASPALTGNPTAPTQSVNDNSTKIATTAYADAKVQNSLSASTTIAPSATQVNTGLALKQDKSVGAYKMLANNTASTANLAEIDYRSSGQLAYTDTITFTAGTAPSGASNLTYNWQRVGNWVDVCFTFDYAVAGATVSLVTIAFPSSMPLPVVPTGFSGASNLLYLGSGQLSVALNTSSASSSDMFSFIRRNAADTAFEFGISGQAASYKTFKMNIKYPVS